MSQESPCFGWGRIQETPGRHTGFHLPSRHRAGTTLTAGETTTNTTNTADTTATATRARVFAGLRIVTGSVFLWAFLDKTFGWGYATASGKGWADGGSPTKGFLSGVAVGPMESTFHSWAGAGWANRLFMLGLLGVGLALVSGIALRLAAVATVMLAARRPVLSWLGGTSPRSSSAAAGIGCPAPLTAR